ncbi:hypothetical protein SDC9_202142 [bioreactor metagenome]|uniref:Peptidase M16 C-terminal domain-containing protein n=1 Tax=bioreactor metagenome TaxID=1076179 RepID=A0A645IUF3_9ZZZZ
MASVELMPNKIEEGVSLFTSQLSQIYKYGFLSTEIEKVKKAFISSKERAAKSVQPTSSSVLIDEVYADFYKGYMITTPKEEYRLTKKYIDRIDSVSIVHALHQLADPGRTHYIFSSFEENSINSA